MTKRCSNVIFSALLLSLLPIYSTAATDSPVTSLTSAPEPSTSAPIVYWTEKKDNPRPIIIHCIRIDLQDPAFEVFTMISDDPDGIGPADAKLEEPLKLAARHQAIVAVNANGFQSLKSTKGENDNNWFVDKPIRIIGLAVSNGIPRSKLSANHYVFWLDDSRKPFMGTPEAKETIKTAVSEWSGFIVHKGKIITSSMEKLHPRTLTGIDQSNRWLFLVVVDGRQPEISEGANLFEAAEIMKKLGCHEAIAMDGGGSSIMLLNDNFANGLRIVNRPAGGTPRPIPVMLGVRRKAPLPKPSGDLQ